MKKPSSISKCRRPGPAAGSPDWVKPGAKVWTEAASGSPILCTVIEPDTIIEGEWLLESPAHGYAIQRHYSEMEPENTETDQRP